MSAAVAGALINSTAGAVPVKNEKGEFYDNEREANSSDDTQR